MNKWFALLGFALLLLQLAAKSPYVFETLPMPDGRLVDRVTVPGIPVAQRVPGPPASFTRSTVLLGGVPAFDWSYGCSATSAAMLAAYYDRGLFSHVYTGPAGGGVMPLNNSAWGPGECPLSATHMGYDGLASPGHVDRFWTNSSGDDPFGTGDPTGTYFGCTADYMGTNQQWWGNGDGSTTFAYYVDGSPLYDPGDGLEGPPYFRDGIHGLKLFFESRGYAVSANYNQYIYGWNGNANGYTYAQFKVSIDSGIPVLIQIEGHTMLGIGYESASDTIYVLNTWDYSIHTMAWGGIYSGMAHYGVGVLQLIPPPLININGASLSAALLPGAETTQSFQIVNSGTGPLYYDLVQVELRGAEADSGCKPLPVADGRSIAGSTLALDASAYLPGTTLDWNFTLYNASTDDEWLKYLYVTFPAGVVVNSASNFTRGGGGDLIPDPSSGNGVTICWGVADPSGWGVVYPGNTASATVNVTILPSFTGDLALSYQINGDVYGADPHVVTGAVTLTQTPWPIAWFHALPANGTVAPGSSQAVTGYFSAAGLAPGTYHARLTVNANDPWNPAQTVDVTLDVLAGEAPQITEIYRSSGGTTLSWQALPGASGYKVYRSTSPGGAFSLLNSTTASTYQDPSNLPSAFYRVTAEY